MAEWLQNKPKEAELDPHFFVILDRTAMKGDIVICRIGGVDLANVADLDFLRVDAEMGAMMLFAAQPGMWEELRDADGRAEIEY